MAGWWKRFVSASGNAIAVGGDNVGIVVSGRVRGDVMIVNGTAVSPAELTLPWRTPRQGSVESLLQWRSRLTPLLGRSAELAELRRWAEGPPKVSVKLLSGAGGTGKSRLACEFAAELRNSGWAAGLLDLSQAHSYKVGASGTLVVVDYAEEEITRVRRLLAALARLEEPPERLRILLTTRRKPAQWAQDLVVVAGVVDDPLILGALGDADPYELFTAAHRNACGLLGAASVRPCSVAEFNAWLQRSELHERPLFVVAYAVQCAMDPSFPEAVGREVFSWLVLHERRRWRELSEKQMDPDALFRLKGLACVTGGLNADQLRALADDPGLELHLPATSVIVDRVRETQEWEDGVLPPVEPDLLGACVLFSVLHDEDGSERDLAGRWLSRCIGVVADSAGVCGRLSRLAWDINQVLQLNWPGESLATAVSGDVLLSEHLSGPLAATSIPVGLQPLATAVWQTLSEGGESVEITTRFDSLRCLARSQYEMGDYAGALDTIVRANEIAEARRGQATAAELESHANILNDLATYSAQMGEPQDNALSRAISILRTLLTEDRVYETSLARCLSNASVELLGIGDVSKAKELIAEAVEIERSVAHGESSPDLVAMLNNQARCLRVGGDLEAASRVVDEALGVGKSLWTADPARYQGLLSTILINKSTCLAAVGDLESAIESASEAITLRKQLARTGRAVHIAECAEAMDIKAGYLRSAGDYDGALTANIESIDYWRQIENESQGRLARSLHNLALSYAECGQASEALRSVEEAIEIRRKLAGLGTSHVLDYVSSLTTSGDILALRSSRSAWLDYSEAARFLSSQPNPGRFKETLNELEGKISSVYEAAGGQ